VVNIPEDTPTDAVIQYRQQGYDTETIKQGLIQQGYSEQQVLDAFNQADMKPQAIASPVQGMAPPQQYGSANSSEDTEAIVESLIEEKWQDLQQQLKQITEWKERIDSQVIKLTQEMGLLKENFDKLHEGVLGKISEYDNNLKDVGSSVKAMDEVFKKVLPTMTESVNKLSKLANTPRR